MLGRPLCILNALCPIFKHKRRRQNTCIWRNGTRTRDQRHMSCQPTEERGTDDSLLFWIRNPTFWLEGVENALIRMRIRCRSAICSEYRPISGMNPVGQCMPPCILKSELGEEKTAAGCCTNARYLRRRPRKRSLSRNFECRAHAMCRMSAAMMRGEREALLTD